jgi:hypothetical protein
MAMLYTSLLIEKIFTAAIAVATPCRYDGGGLAYSRRTMPIPPQRRQSPVLLPPVRHNGGCSRVCRRFLSPKSCLSVAVPVFAAAHFGSKYAICATSATT